MSVRVERHGVVEPLTPRFIRFLEEALNAQSLDACQDPTERRADYTCFRGLAAIEVKTLGEDASVRVSNLTDKLRENRDWPAFYGKWPMERVLSNADDPAAVRDQLYDKVGRAIVRHIHKANKQLAAHSLAFPRKNNVRILILINEDHCDYHPEMMTYILSRALSRTENDEPKYANIDAMVFMSERHATVVGQQLTYPIVILFGKRTAPWKENVVYRITRAWSVWNNARYIDISEKAIEALQGFSTIDVVPDRMRRQELWQLEYRRMPYMRSWSKEL
jgi:hypothetical protein